MQHPIFNALAHILVIMAFAFFCFLLARMVSQVQADRATPETWPVCRMCGGCGHVPPLPEVIP